MLASTAHTATLAPLTEEHGEGGTEDASIKTASGRFVAAAEDLIIGKPEDAARGLGSYMGIHDQELHERLVHGVAAIRVRRRIAVAQRIVLRRPRRTQTSVMHCSKIKNALKIFGNRIVKSQTCEIHMTSFF